MKAGTDRAAALAVLRWVLGHEPMDVEAFERGFETLPPYLRPLAATHGLTHLEGLADPLRARFAAMERAGVIAWMARRSVVTTIQSTLDAAGIPMVFLKGVALAEQVYPSPATRAMSDVDVWVREEDLNAATRVLADAGFFVPARHARFAQLRGPLPDARQMETTVAGGGVFVEIHCHPASLRDLGAAEMDRLWSTAHRLPASGLPVLRLDAQLLHICLHASRGHGFASALKGLVDVGMLLRRWPDDDLWDEFTGQVLRVHAKGAVYIPLSLARSDLGAPVPPSVLDRLQVPGASEIMDRARSLLWLPIPSLPAGTKHLAGVDAEPGRLRNRLHLRWGATAEDRREASRPDLRLVAAYLWSRLSSLGKLAARGEFLRPSFWRRVATERRARLIRQDMRRAEEGPSYRAPSSPTQSTSSRSA